MEEADKFKYLGSMFAANGQGIKEIRGRINLARSAFSRRVERAVVRSNLFLSCETWPLRVAGERMMEVFDNDSICRILHVRCRDCVSSAELRRRLRITGTPALLV